LDDGTGSISVPKGEEVQVDPEGWVLKAQ